MLLQEQFKAVFISLLSRRLVGYNFLILYNTLWSSNSLKTKRECRTSGFTNCFDDLISVIYMCERHRFLQGHFGILLGVKISQF